MKANLLELLEEMREPAAAADMPASWQHPTIEVLARPVPVSSTADKHSTPPRPPLPPSLVNIITHSPAVTNAVNAGSLS